MAKQNEKILDELAFIVDMCAIAEMRQCQSSARGTDAARMTSSDFMAESAWWPSNAQRAVLDA
eukprot:9489394-Pyramimonas_sp.AAC.1